MLGGQKLLFLSVFGLITIKIVISYRVNPNLQRVTPRFFYYTPGKLLMSRIRNWFLFYFHNFFQIISACLSKNVWFGTHYVQWPLQAPGKAPPYLNILAVFDPYVWLLTGASILVLTVLVLLVVKVRIPVQENANAVLFILNLFLPMRSYMTGTKKSCIS